MKGTTERTKNQKRLKKTDKNIDRLSNKTKKEAERKYGEKAVYCQRCL